MNNEFTREIVEKIRRLYTSEPAAQVLFDWTAQRTKDATSTSIARLSHQLGISRGETVALARQLEEAGCGRFVVGRHGQKSRFAWSFSCISLGQAASGESTEIEKPDDPLPEDEDENGRDEITQTAAQLPLKLSLPQAKDALANYLGIPASSIEITIRA